MSAFMLRYVSVFSQLSHSNVPGLTDDFGELNATQTR